MRCLQIIALHLSTVALSRHIIALHLSTVALCRHIIALHLSTVALCRLIIALHLSTDALCRHIIVPVLKIAICPYNYEYLRCVYIYRVVKYYLEILNSPIRVGNNELSSTHSTRPTALYLLQILKFYSILVFVIYRLFEARKSTVIRGVQSTWHTSAELRNHVIAWEAAGD